MQILWIGCWESEEEFKNKANKGYNLASAQVSQQSLISGIEKVSGLTFDSINGSVLPSYPLYADRDVEKIEWNHKPGAYDVSVGYKNDKYINRFNCKKAMLKETDSWIRNRYKKEGLVVFAYSMRSASMAAACKIKRYIPEAKIYLVVSDLPQFMDLGQNRIKAVLKWIDWQSIKKMKNQFNGFILYASKMADFLNISDRKWLLMEGSYEINEREEKQEISRKRSIMYAGKLDKEYGICMLLEAFMKMSDPNIEIWITGAGNAENYVRECEKKDRRIKFYGFLPSHSEILRKQKEASILVNMRLPSEPASAYCFPSKLFEYMATGVPVLSFRIEGIPVEYYEYLFLIEDENVEAVKQSMELLMNLPAKIREEKGENAKKFILKYKNSFQQCEKIWRWIME